jgi:hypothetical protein
VVVTCAMSKIFKARTEGALSSPAKNPFLDGHYRRGLIFLSIPNAAFSVMRKLEKIQSNSQIPRILNPD